MFQHYLKASLRSLWRNKFFSGINIFGLAIGLAVCLLIALFVTDELSYDRYNLKADRIYRVNADVHVGGLRFNDRVTPGPLGLTLTKDFPDIEKTVRVDYSGSGTMLVKKGETTLEESHACFADPTLFDVFTLPMVAGDPKTALVRPQSMVLSESMAKKYFGSTDVIGKTLMTDNAFLYTITGVIRDMPETSHIRFDFIRAMSQTMQPEWLNNSVTTYVLVRPGVSEQMLDRELDQTVIRYIEPGLKQVVHSSVADLARKGDYFRFTAMPLTRIHLYSQLTTEAEPGGNFEYVCIFVAIGVLILLLACVNFMNLSTSRSAGRSREVGVRKVLGSRRSGLVVQFLVESLLTSGLALGLGMLLAMLLLPYLNQLAGRHVSFTVLPLAWWGPCLLGTMVVVGLLAGSYPAFFLSAFKPVQVLKGTRGDRRVRTSNERGMKLLRSSLAMGLKGSWLRNALVVFQFTTAVILIIGTLTIENQLRYMQNKDVGYDREQVLVVQNISSLWIHAQDFKQQVLSLPGVISGTMTGTLPTATNWSLNAYSRDASRNPSQAVGLGRFVVDADYIPTLGMQMAAGRNFSPQMSTDSGSVLINETAARLLGYKDPLQHALYREPATHSADTVQVLPIIGVVKDFNTGSLRHKIPPLVFELREWRDKMAFRVKTDHLPELIAQIEAKYHAVDKMEGQPFVYSFLDADFDRLYVAERRTGRLFGSFAAFAILIACLGLFGLVTYAAEQRMREIGIRKVLGASVTGIVRLLSADFLRLVGISVVVALPLAWWLMRWWLEGFAYRAAISGWVFGGAALMALVIALGTVSVQALRAARANPVKSLRAE
jgi:putative ABC transport system permease protein